MVLNLIFGAGAAQSLLGRFGRVFLILVFGGMALFGFVLIGWVVLWLLKVFLNVPIPITDPLTPVNWLASIVTAIIRLTPVVIVIGFAEAGVGIIYTITYIAAGLCVLAALLAILAMFLLRNNPEMAQSLFGFATGLITISGNLLSQGSTIAGNLTTQAYGYLDKLQTSSNTSPDNQQSILDSD